MNAWDALAGVRTALTRLAIFSVGVSPVCVADVVARVLVGSASFFAWRRRCCFGGRRMNVFSSTVDPDLLVDGIQEKLLHRVALASKSNRHGRAHDRRHVGAQRRLQTLEVEDSSIYQIGQLQLVLVGALLGQVEIHRCRRRRRRRGETRRQTYRGRQVVPLGDGGVRSSTRSGSASCLELELDETRRSGLGACGQLWRAALAVGSGGQLWRSGLIVNSAGHACMWFAHRSRSLGNGAAF